MSQNIPHSDSYRAPLHSALYVQCVIVVLCGLLLDFGVSARIATITMVAFWVGVLLIMLRRPRTPTVADLWIVRFGFLPLFVILQILTRCVWHWQGFL